MTDEAPVTNELTFPPPAEVPQVGEAEAASKPKRARKAKIILVMNEDGNPFTDGDGNRIEFTSKEEIAAWAKAQFPDGCDFDLFKEAGRVVRTVKVKASTTVG